MAPYYSRNVSIITTIVIASVILSGCGGVVPEPAPQGTVYTWGADNARQLGIGGSGVPSSWPVIPCHMTDCTTGLFGVRQVSAGGHHSLALGGSQVFAWGENGGDLGQGVNMGFANKPLRVCNVGGCGNGFLPSIKQVSASHKLSFAVGMTGGVYAFGDDGWDPIWLGTGGPSSTDAFAPVQVCAVGGCANGHLADIKQVDAGRLFNVAVSNAGDVYAWGGGFLGDGTNAASSVPVRVCAVGGCNNGFLTGIKEVSVGLDHALALANNGDVYAWGSGRISTAPTVFGKLGNGDTAHSLVPVPVCDLGGCGHGFLGNIAQIQASEWSSIAVGLDGMVYTWGNGGVGRLGNGGTAHANVPVRVCAPSGCASGALTGITQASMSETHSLARSATGLVYSWGHAGSSWNGVSVQGKLGHADGSVDTNVPEIVCAKGGCVNGPLTGIVQVSAGWQHSMAVTAVGNT